VDLRHDWESESVDADPRRQTTMDWPRLFACETATDALTVIAGWLGPPILGLRLGESSRLHAAVAEWRISDDCRATRRFERIVAGQPSWTLTLSTAFDPHEQLSFDQAAWALAAWRQQRVERDRELLRLTAHTQELNLIQVLGQRCAEARTPAELFAAGVEILERSELAASIVVAHDVGGDAVIEFHGGAPDDPTHRKDWLRRARGILGWRQDRQVTLQVEQATGPLAGVDEESLVILPLLRGDRVVACLILVPTAAAVDREMRLAYSAGNQMALHLDRILTVMEVESDRTRSLLASLPQAVVLLDAGQRIVLVNPAGEELLRGFELEPSGPAGPLIATLGIENAVGRVEADEQLVVEDEVYGQPDRAIAVTVSSVPAPGGKFLAIVLADVSERRRSQQRLAHSEKMTSLGQMISGVAHELNNPLSSVLGYAQLLARAGADETGRRRLDTLEREAQRCQRIVQNLLSFARRRGNEHAPTSLNEVVESVLGLLGYQLRVSGVDVQHTLDPSLAALTADRHELQQLLVNLLTNAKHALQGQDGQKRIEIRTGTTVDDTLWLEVEDSGPGIPEAIRHKIFEPFYTTKGEGEGTGLGLSLSYDIVRTHGGRIAVSDGSQGGALFRMVFPPAGRAATGGVDGTVGDSIVVAPPSLRAATILVVDDEKDVAAMIRDALAEDGHTIRHAHDATTAMQLLREIRFDLLITDLRMPGVDGAQLIEEIRRAEGTANLPVLLTTGDTISAEAGGLRESLEVGWIQKPFELDDLRRAVAERLVRD